MQLALESSSRIRRIVSVFVILACCLSTTAVQAQQGFISDTIAETAGLTVAWSTQVGISPKNTMIDWQLIIDENQSTTYFVVKSKNRREIFSEKDISPFGTPYGIEGAKDAAMIRKEIIEMTLKNDGVAEPEVTVTSYTLPRSTILTLGSSGLVASIDADTGRTNWIQQIGDAHLPSSGLGASKEHIAVTNGSHIYCLEFESGRFIWEKECRHMVTASPACKDGKIYAPLANGKLQVFDIESFGVDNYQLVALGEAHARPMFTENNVVWTTDEGHMNVSPLGEGRTVSYRLKTSGPIMTQAAAGLEMLFAGSLDGFIYAVSEEQGRLEWEASTGQGATQAPVLIDKYLYVVSESNQLFKIDAERGQAADRWKIPTPNIAKIVGFGKDTVYCLDTRGSLVGIGRESHSITKTLRSSGVELTLTNSITDRLYVGSKSGFIQCIHEIGSTRPRSLAKDLAMNEKPSEDTMDTATPEANPFGEAANPFGGDAAPMEDDANPFGDSDAEEDDDDANPFG